MPPQTTDATGPNQAAVAPDSNSPSGLDAPMNTEFTARAGFGVQAQGAGQSRREAQRGQPVDRVRAGM